MEYFKIRKADGSIVSALKEIPENASGIVIAIHGFTSNKECPTCQLLLRRMPAAGLGVIGIDLPGHGTEESAEEELRIENCKNSIAAAERYAAEQYPGQNIFYFASSFGAYITGLYISTREHLGRKAFFRSAAVNMPDLFIKKERTPEETRQMDQLRREGFFETSMELHRPVKITQGMFHDFETTDLFKVFDPNRYGKNQICLIHGADDEVIDPEAVKRFSALFSLPLTVIKGEGHSLSNDPRTPEYLADLAIAFYIDNTSYGKTLNIMDPG